MKKLTLAQIIKKVEAGTEPLLSYNGTTHHSVRYGHGGTIIRRHIKENKVNVVAHGITFGSCLVIYEMRGGKLKALHGRYNELSNREWSWVVCDVTQVLNKIKNNFWSSQYFEDGIDPNKYWPTLQKVKVEALSFYGRRLSEKSQSLTIRIVETKGGKVRAQIFTDRYPMYKKKLPLDKILATYFQYKGEQERVATLKSGWQKYTVLNMDDIDKEILDKMRVQTLADKMQK